MFTFFPFFPRAYKKKRGEKKERRMTNIPAAWWLSPARELTPNAQVISTPHSDWACFLLCATMQSCWLAFKLLQQTATSWDSSSVCLSADWSMFPFTGPGTGKNWVKRKTGRCLLLWGETSAEALSCAGGTGRADACCSSRLSQEMIHAQERRTLWWVWSI